MKYRPIHKEVEAFCFTNSFHRNILKDDSLDLLVHGVPFWVSELVGGEGSYSLEIDRKVAFDNDIVLRFIKDDFMEDAVINPNDYLVKDPLDSYEVLSEKDFHMRYERVE